MNLTRVTFTGIDNQTDLQRLSRLGQQYPFAEFGLLVSKKWKENGPRYPDPSIIWRLANMWSQEPIALSCHLCGELAMAAAHGDYTFIESVTPPELFSIFERVQLNLDSERFLTELHRLKRPNKEVIVQMRSAAVCRQFIQEGSPEQMAYLIDASGGRGIDTKIEVLAVPGIHIGYAGGIGPENIERKLLPLLEEPSDCSFWLDMESRVRTSDDRFDLDKVEEVLVICDRILKESH